MQAFRKATPQNVVPKERRLAARDRLTPQLWPYAWRVFIRVKRRAHGDRAYEYLQIVRSVREGDTVRQQVIANLGRREQLVASGELDGLLRSLARFSEKLRVVEAARTTGLEARSARSWGPALVFGRLWEKQGLPAVLDELRDGRRFEFDVQSAPGAQGTGGFAPAPTCPVIGWSLGYLVVSRGHGPPNPD